MAVADERRRIDGQSMVTPVVSRFLRAARPASGGAARDRLLSRLNRAVRRPEQFGGLATLPVLLDRLADAERQTGKTVWIPDTNARLSPAAFMREAFPDPAVHVIASQYGEDAFKRGWLSLDRTLDSSEFTRLVDSVESWSKVDHTIYDVVAEYGAASVTFGDPDVQRPKTLGYASADRAAPFVVFHLGAAEPGAVLLAVRFLDELFNGWQVTPRGDAAL